MKVKLDIDFWSGRKASLGEWTSSATPFGLDAKKVGKRTVTVEVHDKDFPQYDFTDIIANEVDE